MSQALPSWAEPYLDDFAGILRVVSLSGGFVLLPVEVPGPDLGQALADWLGSKGHPALVRAPRDDEEWRQLSTWLLCAKPEEGGVVVVIAGSELPPEGVSLAFRLVNQRRDAISKRLACPLLWCGPREFLLSTAERAPDFWSVRAVERRLLLREKEEKPREEERAAASSKDDLLAEARRQGDRKSISILTVRQVNLALAAGALDEAEALLAGAPEGMGEKDPEASGEIELLRAEVARRQGRVYEARSVLSRLIGMPGQSKTLECRVGILLGRVQETGGASGLFTATHYQVACELARSAREPALELLASYRHAAALPTSNVLDKWRTEGVRGIDDRPLEALVMALVAAAKATSLDLAGAKDMLSTATELWERAKDDPTILFGGEVEEELQKTRAVLARFEGKKEAASPAPAVPTTHLTTTKSARRWLLAAALTLGAVAMLVYWTQVEDTAPNHCFVVEGGRILCAPTPAACEKLRGAAGPAAGPCQKVTPISP